MIPFAYLSDFIQKVEIKMWDLIKLLKCMFSLPLQSLHSVISNDEMWPQMAHESLSLLLLLFFALIVPPTLSLNGNVWYKPQRVYNFQQMVWVAGNALFKL